MRMNDSELKLDMCLNTFLHFLACHGMDRYLINSIFRFILLIFLTKLRSTGDVMMMIERRKKGRKNKCVYYR